MKERESNQSMIDIYVQVIDKNLNNLFNTIDLIKQEVNKKIMNEQNNKEIERQSQQSAKLIKILPIIREEDSNKRILILIHLNCSPNINCQQCVNVPQSPAILELKSSVFKTLTEVSEENHEFKIMLQNDHNIIPHLAHPFVLFASQYKFNQEIIQNKQYNQQLQEPTSSQSFIISSVNLLKSLINNNTCKQIIKIPNALHSLSILTRYQINSHLNQQYDLQTLKFRSCNRECLRSIQEYGDISVQSELANIGYFRVLIIAITTAGGNGEEQDLEISDGIDRISNFLIQLHEGRNNYWQPSFLPQPLLAKRSMEQIEEEGGREEVDAQLVNNGIFVMHKAKKIKGLILNYFINKNNPIQIWFN